VIVLDAYALVAVATDEPAAPEVERLLRNERCTMSTINIAETLDVLVRVHELPREDVHALLDPVIGSEVEPLAPDAEDAWQAAALRARYYERRRRPLSLADCFLLAAARDEGAVATADPAVIDVARSEGLGLLALPDSSGRLR
jgi:predicted nucleic acid-binding protein